MEEVNQAPEIDLDSLSWLPRLVAENPNMGLVVYVGIVILAILVYNFGFARKLPILKAAVVYVMLMIGCMVLTVLAIMGAPIIEVLLIATAVLGIYKIRLRNKRDEVEG